MAQALSLSGHLTRALFGGRGPSRLRTEPPTPGPLAGRVRLGAYVWPTGWASDCPEAAGDLLALEERLGLRFEIVHCYWDWGRPFEPAVAEALAPRELMLTWKPDREALLGLARLRPPPYVDDFARAAAAHGAPIHLRFAPEMNNQWMPYCSRAPGGPSPSQFRSAWRCLVGRFRSLGAGNVRFVWSPMECDVPSGHGNRMEDYWPGEAWVDVIGFSAYNWGSNPLTDSDGSCRSFAELVEAPYERLAALSGRPVWLTEFGTSGPNAGEWFRTMFTCERFPRLQTLVYFSDNDNRDAHRDWRIDANDASLDGWREGWALRAALR